MKNNKTASQKNSNTGHFTNTTAIKAEASAAQAPQHDTTPVQVQSGKIVRRYSFDDNGGGYLGL